MIDKEKVKTATLEMTKNNPDWKEILVGAPGAANLRIALAFYASKNLESMSSPEKDEYREFREQLEAQLTAEELKYLAESFARMGLDTAKDHYWELYYKKGGAAGGGEKTASVQQQVGAAGGTTASVQQQVGAAGENGGGEEAK